MSDIATLDLSPADAALAGLCLAAALEGLKAAQDNASVMADFLTRYPNLQSARLAFIAPLVAEMADAADGLEAVLAVISDNLSAAEAETAYMIWADFIARHGRATPEQLQLLTRLGEALRLERLTRAALDRAALARTRVLSGETSP